MELIELFMSFLKIGAFSFGGGYSMIPLIQDEVQSHNWLSPSELVDFIAVSESTPGPVAVNIATFVGSRTAGVLGAIYATVGVVLPSFLIILIVAKLFDKFRKSMVVNGCMTGLRPAVVGMIGAALLNVGGTVFFPTGMTAEVFTQSHFYISAAIFAVCAVMAFKKLHPIVIILFSAAVGIAAGYLLYL